MGNTGFAMTGWTSGLSFVIVGGFDFAVVAVRVARISVTSTSLLPLTDAANSCRQHDCLSNLIKFSGVGLSHNPPFCLMMEKKFSSGSWFSRRVKTNFKSWWSRRSADSFKADEIESCQLAKHLTEFVTFFPSEVFTDMLDSHSREFRRKFVWSHVPQV